MNDSILVGLINNTALLLTIALVYDLVATRWKIGKTGLIQIPTGVFLGVVGIVLMLTPWVFIPGIIFDTRSILLSISGLFFGLIPTLIAMIMTAVFRIMQGGAATLTGVSVIVATGSIGLLWRHLQKKQLVEIKWRELYLFGVINHLVMLGLMFLLPLETALQVLNKITLPVLAIYPISTVLIGVLMVNRLKRDIKDHALQESEAKFRQVFETAGIGISLANLKGEFISGNPAILSILGYTQEEYKQLSVEKITHPEDLEKNLQIYQNYRDGDLNSVKIEKRNYKKNGEIVWGQLTSTLVRDENGKPAFTIGMFEDITERKQDQMALKLLLDTADQSRRALLSVIEDQKFSQEALSKLTNDLIIAYDSTLKGWSNALELREHETAGHSKRVVNLTLELAKRLNVPSEELIHFERGALLHDIGKMGIPDSILSKPGPLTDDEWVEMRRHPSYACKLLSEINYLKPALAIPYGHHERWDGTGYPQGLKGEEIPLAARIFSIVDVWDALSSDRPYRSAWDQEKIINYLEDQAGKQFDPQVVEAFLKLIES